LNIVSGELDITRKKLPNKASALFNKKRSKLSDGTKSSLAGNDSFFMESDKFKSIDNSPSI